MEKFKKIKPTTSPQEGLGGFFQYLNNFKKMNLKEMMEHIITFCLGFEKNRQLAKHGLSLKYGSGRVTNKTKQKSQEKHINYRPPDTSERLLSFSKGTNKKRKRKNISDFFHKVHNSNTKITQMTNIGNTCFMSSIVQCIVASDIATSAIDSTQCCNKIACKHSFRAMKSVVIELQKRNNETQETLIPENLTLSAKNCTPCFPVNSQNDPADYIQRILEDPCLKFEPVDDLFRVILTNEFKCDQDDCDGFGVTFEEDQFLGYQLSLPIPNNGVHTVKECLYKEMLNEEKLPNKTCNHCNRKGEVSKVRTYFKKRVDGQDQVLLMSMNIYSFQNISKAEKSTSVCRKKETIIIPSLTIDFTNMYKKEDGKEWEGKLCGYTINDGDSPNSGHYKSVTRVLNKTTNKYHYVISDDLHPNSSYDIGTKYNGSFPHPYNIMYEISLKTEKNEENDSVATEETEIKSYIENNNIRATRSKNPFCLPFSPKLKSEMTSHADIIRKAYSRQNDDASLPFPGQKKKKYYDYHSGAPIFQLRKDGKLHLSKPITLSNYKPVVKSNIHISRCEVLHLGDNLCVGESVLCCFARDFNAREFSKREKDPDYIPCHMFDTYIMEKIKKGNNDDINKFTQRKY